MTNYQIERRLITRGTKRRSGLPMDPGVRFVVAHDTGNPGSTADANVRYYISSANERSQSAHIFVDDQQIIECVPALTGPPEKAWHVLYSVPTDDRMFGYDANDAAVGVEYCYGGRIDPDEAYRRYVWVIAMVCRTFGLDPSRSVVGHFFLDPTRRDDPVLGLKHSRRTYEQLLRDVVAEHGVQSGAQPGASQLTATQGSVVATARLNLRRDAPSTRSPVGDIAAAGTKLDYVGWTDAGEPVNGNSRWYKCTSGFWFWSGATRA